MTDARQESSMMVPAGLALSPVSAAKERLMTWAQECDARTLKSRSSWGSIAGGGALAVLGGMAVASMVKQRRQPGTPESKSRNVGRRIVSWALLVRASTWLLPIVIKTVQSGRKSHAAP